MSELQAGQGAAGSVHKQHECAGGLSDAEMMLAAASWIEGAITKHEQDCTPWTLGLIERLTVRAMEITSAQEVSRANRGRAVCAKSLRFFGICQLQQIPG